MELKHQEQVLLRDLGVPSDLLYTTMSRAVQQDSLYSIDDDNCPKLYKYYFEGMAARNLTRAMPSFAGSQVFDSQTRKRPLFNECRNKKTYLICHPYAYSVNDNRIGRTSQWHVAFMRSAVPSGTSLVSAVDSVNWDESDSASRRAWWEMQPRFEGDFQALNFLYELKDFKDIASKIAALRPSMIVESLKKAKSTIRRARRAVEGGDLSHKTLEIAQSITGTAAKGILIKHFAIDPTVRDLASLHAQLKELVNDVQHRFRDKGHTLNRRHYTEEISRDSQTVVGSGDPKKNYYEHYYRTGLERVDTFTATLEFTYDYKLREKTEALKRYYGGEFNASVVWNALPFSFLIDYFIGVSDAIERMSLDPNVVLQAQQYCESRLVDFKSGMMHNRTSATMCFIINGAYAADGQLMTGYRGTFYQRRVGSPNKGLATPRVKLPSVKQAVNMAALVRCMW